jgi:hypothetical protein
LGGAAAELMDVEGGHGLVRRIHHRVRGGHGVSKNAETI